MYMYGKFNTDVDAVWVQLKTEYKNQKSQCAMKTLIKNHLYAKVYIDVGPVLADIWLCDCLFLNLLSHKMLFKEWNQLVTKMLECPQKYQWQALTIL